MLKLHKSLLSITCLLSAALGSLYLILTTTRSVLCVHLKSLCPTPFAGPLLPVGNLLLSVRPGAQSVQSTAWYVLCSVWRSSPYKIKSRWLPLDVLSPQLDA